MHAAMPIVTGQVETKFALAKKEKKKRKKPTPRIFSPGMCVGLLKVLP